MKLFIAALASVAFATDVSDTLAAQEAAIASADAAQDAVLTQAEIDEANELSWTESFTAERADDLVTIACLCYDELSTWDRKNSLAPLVPKYQAWTAPSNWSPFNKMFGK